MESRYENEKVPNLSANFISYTRRTLTRVFNARLLNIVSDKWLLLLLIIIY